MNLIRYSYTIFLFLIITCCKGEKDTKPEGENTTSSKSEFTIAFGSCNNQVLPNVFWNDILEEAPDVWLWGGDVIYSDTDDMEFLQKNYEVLNAIEDYANFKQAVEILGTWDDHDYGMNDGGRNYTRKKESQQLFLDFLDVPNDSPRRQQEGVYFQKDYKLKDGLIKIIVLDTRYFRSDLVKDTVSAKRYCPAPGGTMLGVTQWNWLEQTLKNSIADFNIILTSIQFLSSEHGFESWGNMPEEVQKMEDLLVKSQASNVIFLSGDRHISEFSKKEVQGLNYPIIDFTSSGLTHSYTGFKGEPNQYRTGEVVSDKSYGLVKIDLETKTVNFEIKGEAKKLLESTAYSYPKKP